MAQEIETKVLDIDTIKINDILLKLGAIKVQDTRFVVDWYRLKGVIEGQDPWFLRIRSRSDGSSELTWKAKSDILGVARRHKEINFAISQPESLGDLFEEIGLERYAHQEKDRISWNYKEWRFDIDKYPNMPPFIEIEGQSEYHVKEGIKLLELENHKTWNDGERTLIQKEYNLDWYDMKFN
jgi:adenylate cyclase class 2